MRYQATNSATKWLTLLAALAALCILAMPGRARADEDDPPTRAARLAYTSGAVSFEPAGTDDWVEAVVNRPLTIGDKLWTDQDSRAELRVDSYALRLGPMTGFSFLNLDDRMVQIRLTEGSLNLRVRRLDEDQTLEVDTPNLAFNVLRPGSYRINVSENGDTTIVTVRDGQGEVTGGGSAYSVHAGESANFYGTDQLSVDVEGYPEDDDFDRWSRDRDRRWDRSGAPRYVSDDVVGYEDLDEYGGWRPVPEYGTVWFPHTTVVGWAPYRYGHWVWVSPWGWTWVDDAPWGFAPFHYGRWVVVGGTWGWVPCPPRPAVVTVAYVRPVYAPALVAFVGGAHWGVGVSVGGAPAGVAWFPLGPRDVYAPAYHVSQTYVQNVNVSNTTVVNRTQITNVYNNVYVNKTTNITNITYQNQNANNAVTATSQASFTSAQPVAKNLVRVDAKEVASAPVAPVAPAVAPQQRSFAGAAAQARVRPPENVIARPVVAKTAPPPPPAPVRQQIQAVQSNGGRPPAISQARAPQAQAAAPHPEVKVAAAAKPAALPPPGRAPANPNANRPGQPPAAQPNANRPPANQPPAQPQPAQPNANRPPAPNQPPAQPQPSQPNNNRPPNANPPNRPAPPQANQSPNRNDRPPAARQSANPQTEQRQQQEMERLRQQQDQERQRVEQQQAQEQEKLQKQKADEQRQQQIQQRQQQQLEQLERKHDQEQQKMEQKHQQETQKEQRQPPKESKPPKEDKSKDRPPH